MFRYLYNSVYMMRMLKDKLYDTFVNYYYSININSVKRMGPSQSLLMDIYNLSSGITHIQDQLYIGNAYGASNYYILSENNIGLIVNVTEEIPNYYEDLEDGFNYIRIIMRDQNSESLFEHLEEYLSKIHEYSIQYPNNTILVHCYMGSSRSATIICAYLIKYYNFTVSQSIQLLKEKRDIVNINLSFIEDLKHFYNCLHTNEHIDIAINNNIDTLSEDNRQDDSDMDIISL